MGRHDMQEENRDMKLDMLCTIVKHVLPCCARRYSQEEPKPEANHEQTGNDQAKCCWSYMYFERGHAEIHQLSMSSLPGFTGWSWGTAAYIFYRYLYMVHGAYTSSQYCILVARRSCAGRAGHSIQTNQALQESSRPLYEVLSQCPWKSWP